MLLRKNVIILAHGALAFAASTASATSVTFEGTSGPRSAIAVFTESGNDLIVTLTSTAPIPAMNADELLTGIYFNINGSAESLTRVSASISASGVCPQNLTSLVTGAWAYRSGVPNLPTGQSYAIGSSSLSHFLPTDQFPRNPHSSTPGSNNDRLTDIQDDNNPTSPPTTVLGLSNFSMIFTLTGLSGTFEPSEIESVLFQYGILANSPSFEGFRASVAPLPSAAGAGFVTIGLALARRRRR